MRPVGKLTELPDPLAGFQGDALQQGMGGKGGEEGKEENGRDSVPPSFFTI